MQKGHFGWGILHSLPEKGKGWPLLPSVSMSLPKYALNLL